jgi:hypothetical protein
VVVKEGQISGAPHEQLLLSHLLISLALSAGPRFPLSWARALPLRLGLSI